MFAVLPFHPLWSVEQLAVVTRGRGFPGWTSRSLTADDVRRIAPALTPVVEKWLDRENEGRLVALAATVRRKLTEWPELAAVLERLLHKSAHQYTAASAMALLAKHLPKQRERIVTDALAHDESWILQPAVMNFVNARRQDLLTPFLGQRAYSGRFSTGRVRQVLAFASGFHKWTDSQQELFATSLAELAQPPKRSKDTQVTWDVMFAVRRLAELPSIEPDRLIALACDARPAVQETTVRALGRLDARQGIPELLEALGDARSRFADYALRAALGDQSPQNVLSVMRGIPLEKVTVAKEAVRLAGEFGGTASLEWFAELDSRELHRDVRGALLRALWDHLERPEAWKILDSSVASPESGVVIGLARIPVDRASAEARDRVSSLLGRLLDHPESSVRVAVLARLASQPVSDSRRALFAALLGKLSSAVPDERSGALVAILAAASDADADSLAMSITRLIPMRREVSEFAMEFSRRTRTLGPRLVSLRSAVLAALEREPSLVALQVRLAAAWLAAEPFANWTQSLVGSSRWHAGTQIAALECLRESGQAVEDLERGEAVWSSSADPACRWLALRVLINVASIQGWTDMRRNRLATYQQDAAAMVSDEASLTFPPMVDAGDSKGQAVS